MKNLKIEGEAKELGGRVLNVSNIVHVDIDLVEKPPAVCGPPPALP